jgi:hypothetical protein
MKEETVGKGDPAQLDFLFIFDIYDLRFRNTAKPPKSNRARVVGSGIGLSR